MKYSNVKTILLAAALAAMLPFAHSQGAVYPDRYFPHSTTGFLPNMNNGILTALAGFGEFSRYSSSKSGDYRYGSRAGISVSLLTLHSIDLTFRTDVELAADRHSKIGYNPRSIFWDEAFALSYSKGNLFIRGGYYHRCKHDIDNLELLSERGEHYSRVIIYDSAMAEAALHSLCPASGIGLYASVRADGFTVYEDDRQYGSITSDVIETNGGKLSVSSEITAGADYKIASGFLIRLTGKYSLFFYKNGSVKSDFSVELSGGYQGKGAVFSLFMRYEQLHDNFIAPSAPSDRLMLIGIRASSS